MLTRDQPFGIICHPHHNWLLLFIHQQNIMTRQYLDYWTDATELNLIYFDPELIGVEAWFFKNFVM